MAKVEAASVSDGNLDDETSIPQWVRRIADLDALAAHVDGAFVVVVKVTGDHYRRRCYLTAKAAENAARRATDRGENATIYMAELKPLWRLVGGESEPDPQLIRETLEAFAWGAS